MAAFTPAGSGGAVATVSIEGSTNPTIAVASLASANTEYTVVIPTDTKQFLVKLRSQADLKVGYASASTYLTVPRDCFYAESDLSLSAPITLYLSSPEAGQTAEILFWT